MKNNRGLIWGIVVLAMLGVVLLFFLVGGNNYSWYKGYGTAGKQPYDVGIFVKLLEKNTQNADFKRISKPFNQSLKDLGVEGGYNLFAIKSRFNPDTMEIYAMLKFMERGNHVFLSSTDITALLPFAIRHGIDSLNHILAHINSDDIYADVPDSVYEAYDDYYDSESLDSIHNRYVHAVAQKIERYSLLDTGMEAQFINLKASDEDLTARLHYQYKNEIYEQYWHGLQNNSLPNDRILAQYDSANFNAIVQWPVGKGSLTVCANPLLYTNFHIRDKNNFAFINGMLRQLPNQKVLIDDVNHFHFDWGGYGPRGLSKSPLSFILSKRELSWAWFVFLGTVLLYLLFKSKRTQRIIPVAKPNKNTTLAYAQLLGSLQLKEHNNTKKAQQVVQHFLQHLRTRNRWHSNTTSPELQQKLLKLAPDLKREIELMIHISYLAEKNEQITDLQLINLFNSTNTIKQRL